MAGHKLLYMIHLSHPPETTVIFLILSGLNRGLCPSTRKLIIYIIELFECHNDPRTSKRGTDFIDTTI